MPAECGEWAFGQAFVGPLLGRGDPPIAARMTAGGDAGMQECQAICLADEECGVATFYDASWECALRRLSLIHI